MPFTFAHPAVILPLGRLPKRWVSLTGLITGSMVPDFEYFVRMRISSVFSHTWFGLFWFDVPLGLLLVFVYQKWVKHNLIAHLPLWLNRRFSTFYSSPRYSLRYLSILMLSIFTGAATHLLWDGFTHPHGYFVQHIFALKQAIILYGRQIEVYKILQHLSTIAGFIIIFYAILVLPSQGNTKPAGLFRYWATVTIVTLAVLFARYLTSLSITAYGDWIVSSISGFLFGLLAASIFSNIPHPNPFKTHENISA